MKIVILKNNLKIALDIAGKGIIKNQNLPILSNILIKTAGGKVNLSSTDLEIGITCAASGKVIEEGSITVPYVIFNNIISNVSDERINLESKENKLLIKTENYEADIQGISETEFPIIPKITPKTTLEISAEDFKIALDKTIFSAGESDLRPEINGVLFVLNSSGVKLVSTDSFRLAEARIEKSKIKTNIDSEVSLIIPLKTAQVISKTITDEDVATIHLDDAQIAVKIGNTEIISRLIEGKFPDYEAIVPKETITEVDFDRSELVNALRLASSFTSKTKEVVIKVKNNKFMEVYSSDSSVGENKYIIPIKSSGPDVEINFNLNYLLEGIQAENSEKVFMGFNNEAKPTLIKSPSNTLYFYILMPVKA